MNWKEYERKVHKYFKFRFPESLILHDVNLVGFHSNVNRQIDILIEDFIAGYTIKIAVECKDWGKPLDVSNIEEFVGKLNDLKLTKGVMVAKSGYTKAAKNYAKSIGNIHLHILKFEELGNFHGFIGFPCRGNVGAILTPPNGYILNAEIPKEMYSSGLCIMHSMEYTSKQAFINKKFIFFDIPQIDYIENKNDFFDEFIKEKEAGIMKIEEGAEVKYYYVDYKFGKIKIRTTHYFKNKYYETAGFVYKDGFIVAVYALHDLDEIDENLNYIKFIFNELITIKMEGVDPKNSIESWNSLLNNKFPNTEMNSFIHN